MQTHIAKWGNSLALRLPSYIARESKLTEGSTVQIEIRDGSLIVTPVRKKFKLSSLLAGMEPRMRHEEFDWGAPKGDEEW